MERKNLIIADADMDGFLAAFICHLAFETHDDNDHIWITDKSKKLSLLTEPGQDIYILDLSLSETEIVEISKIANKLVIIDHHPGTIELMDRLDDLPANIEIIANKDMSTSGLADRHFGMNLWMTKYIEDMDLYKWDLDYSNEIISGLSMIRMDFEEWKDIADDDGFKKILKAGKTILKLNNQEISREVNNYMTAENICKNVVISLSGHEVPAINITNDRIKSDVLVELYTWTECPFAVGYTIRPDGKVKFSLRSRKDFDCYAIAMEYGGNGHKNAAEFMESMDFLFSHIQESWKTEE